MEKEIKITNKQSILRDKILSLMDKKSLKASEIARISGRSEGTISELLRSKKTFSDKLLNVIYDALRDYIGENELVSTRQFNKIWSIAKASKQLSDMRLVVGNTGIGKSVVLKKFAEENTRSYYVKIDRKEMTWRQFLLKVCMAMGVRMERKRVMLSTAYLLDRIVKFCEENSDDNPQLIIDESEFAKTSFFKDLKGLFTATEGLLSIVIAGITSVMDTVAKVAGLEVVSDASGSTSEYKYRWYPVKNSSNIFTTFARRVSLFRIDNISRGDIANFCSEKGIRDKKVIEMAASRWWNYDEADRAVNRALRMDFKLDKLTPEEFEVL
jgi:hypothetical protein